MTIMNAAQYLFTRSQHFFELSCKAEDAKQKKVFEAVANDLWLDATTVLNRQVRLVDGLDVETSQVRTRGYDTPRSSAADQAAHR
jgi:hypothetical protein